MQSEIGQIVAYHVIISGKVQGVYYRASTAKKAQALEVVGWVKNRADGSVEMLAQGQPENLERLLSWCEKGPMLAKVSNVQCEVAQVDANMAQFEVMR